MGLSYQDLLTKIEQLLEEKFCATDEKLNKKFDDKFTAVVNDLKRTNSQLLKINAALIERNKQLRNENDRTSDSDDSDGYTEDLNNTPDGLVKTPVVPANHFAPALKDFYDVLILSDSIYRHVGTECPRTSPSPLPFSSEFTVGNVSVRKVVCPGARCVKLMSTAAELNLDHRFGHVILHVCANYFRDRVPPHEISAEINDLMDSIGALFKCGISFSCVLPQVDMGLIDAINSANRDVALFCQVRGYGFLQCMEFARRADRPFLLARDGIHLSRKGAGAMFRCLSEHIIFEHKIVLNSFNDSNN